jgi:hypothetical protein
MNETEEYYLQTTTEAKLGDCCFCYELWRTYWALELEFFKSNFTF